MYEIKMILTAEDGKNILPSSYDFIEVVDKSCILRNNNKYYLYNLVTKSFCTNEHYTFIKKSKWGFYIYKDDKIGFVDFEGNLVLEAKWDKIFFEKKGIIVISDNKRGLIDYKGNELVPCKYKRIEAYNKIIFAYKDGKRYEYKYI